MSSDSTPAPTPLRRPTTDFAVSTPAPASISSGNTNAGGTAKVHDINYILGPSHDQPQPAAAALPAPSAPSAPQTSQAGVPERPTTLTISVLTEGLDAGLSPELGAGVGAGSAGSGQSVQYTPTTHRVSKAKKGKKVHVCEFGCGKVFTRAEHRKRHEANHRDEPLFKCSVVDCGKPFQRLDLLNRHLERQHGIGPSVGDALSASPPTSGLGTTMGPPPPKRPHSSALSGKNDWNAHRGTIERLYIHENKPLKDIKVHMEQNYGFTPVEDRAYEKAFRRLGLSKNIPSSTMEAILLEVEKRRQAGKETTVYWRGQRVDEKRIHRFKQRVARESKPEAVEMPEPPRTFDLPQHVRCLTPNNNGHVYPDPEPLRPKQERSPESSEGEFDDDSSSENEGDARPSTRRFACTSCGEKFSFAGHLTRHAEAHGQQLGRHDCPAPGCPYTENLGFSSTEGLWAHMKEEHMMG